MADLFSTATSGLLAFQRALDTTSHNIANVNTAGYSRQSTVIGTRQPQALSTGFIGSGAETQTVRRSYDQFVAAESRVTMSALERLKTFSAQADNVDNLFSDEQNGLSQSLQSFINAMQDVANSPSSVPARQVVLSQAQSFADRIQAYDARLGALENSIDDRLKSETTTINALARNIADLNFKIEIDQARTGQPPNDLLDQRDRLLDELSTHVSMQVTTQDNGQVIVSIGAGQPLVVGTNASTLDVAQDQYDPTRSVIVLKNGPTTVDITSRLSGGSVGGLLDFRRDMLDTTRNSLGRITTGLVEVINDQHNAGIDLNGAAGQDIFAVGGVDVFPRSGNLGTSALAVTRTQPSAAALTDFDYIAEYTTTGWALRRADTGATVTMTGAGTVGSPFVADGMSIVVSGTATVGDNFLVRPTRGAVTGLKVLIDDPGEIAAAAPIATSAAASNLSNTRISAGEVLDATNPALQTTVSLVFDSPTTYRVNGAGPSIAYTSGANIDINGWRVQVSGTAATGDTFTVGANTNPVGDNRNALQLSARLGRGVFDGGTTSISSASGQLVGRIGVLTSQAHNNQDAQQAIHEDNMSVRDSISGVNLDEEAANLLRFQQAYQAAAQVISIADRLFQTVLDATRR